MIGLMIHSDGSAKPNPGHAGWGMHGYIYEDVLPTKGTGNPDYVLTANDYLSKVDKAAQPNTPLVTPLHYIDGYGAVDPRYGDSRGTTNNQGELIGAIQSLKIAVERPEIQRVRIWTDSKYVVNGFSHALNWRRNNWLKGDGQVPANVELWREYVEIFDALKARGVDLVINWNEGHVGNYGNEIVDMLAFIGMRRATCGMYEPDITIAAPEGYWKYDTERHPFISHRRMYYNTIAEQLTAGEYCIGEHDKEDDLAGKRMANGAYAYIMLNEPETVLEAVRNYSCKVADGENTVMIARVDYIYRADVHKLLSTNGEVVLNRPVKQTASYLDAVVKDIKELVTREHNPPLLIQRCVNELSQLKQILDDYRAGDPSMVITDLTPLIYESLVETNKKGEEKRITRLRPEFVVGTSKMDAVVNYRHPDGSVKEAKIDLLLGLDLLDRNALRRLEEKEPEVRLVTWLEEPSAFRFATIIKVNDAIGIWAGTYSNLRLIL